MENPQDPDMEKKRFRRKLRHAVGLLVLIVLVGLWAAIKTKLIPIFVVASGSMEPTLQIGDHVLIDASAVPELFDIVTFPDPGNPDADPLIKRVIATGNDTVKIESGILYVNGKEQYNKHIKGNHINWDDVKVKVPSECVFVLGDNRNDSYDSLNFGPVKLDNITGVMKYIIWPPGRSGKIGDFNGK